MNRILAITRNTIPYVKELRQFVDSVAGCILMQQLDYWFERYPDGFYKFQSPTEHPQYKPEQSWTEELGFSKEEFRTAFDKIGIRYKSKSEHRSATDKFQGKFYCSYHDRSQGLTYYFRNHGLVDLALDSMLVKPPGTPAGTPPTKSTPPSDRNKSGIVHEKQQRIDPEAGQFTVSKEPQLTVNTEPQFTVNPQTHLPVNPASQLTETDIPNLLEDGNPNLHITDTTLSELTSNTQQLPPENWPSIPVNPTPGSGSDDLIFSENLSLADIDSIHQVIRRQDNLPHETAQLILDELSGVMGSGKLRASPVSFVAGLIRRQEDQMFVPAYALSVQYGRKQQKALEAIKSSTRKPPQPNCSRSEEQREVARKGIESLRNVIDRTGNSNVGNHGRGK